MRTEDAFIRQIKEQLAETKDNLAPLEAGNLHMGEHRIGEPWTDRTADYILWLKRNIAMYEAILAREAA